MTGRRRAAAARLAAVCCAAAAAVTTGTGTFGTAYAAENLPPDQPLVRDLGTGTKVCATGEDRTYVSARLRTR
ncbi:predicted protein [Streptomyces viridosporus ATCC 14672]|uniref:Predicted protein n=1 Tax=Streptomyces viridosporus (strain ATCC 14672 / DSM 40746 / JCM 4963 / KCTC 9882 / NRRL B-12104 / FH 1290) TaxID=566461 RepID=D6A2K8_STRV1|nr:hypothetical protein [Streptomyces viridosporus]EFE71446.1 predicted protein [Streptomyces viridosporus ATCC 14672]